MEDIKSDLIKLFSETNEVVTEEHVSSEKLAEYAQEITTYFTDLAVNFDDERAKELGEKMDAISAFIDKNYYSDYLDR